LPNSISAVARSTDNMCIKKRANMAAIIAPVWISMNKSGTTKVRTLTRLSAHSEGFPLLKFLIYLCVIPNVYICHVQTFPSSKPDTGNGLWTNDRIGITLKEEIENPIEFFLFVIDANACSPVCRAMSAWWRSPVRPWTVIRLIVVHDGIRRAIESKNVDNWDVILTTITLVYKNRQDLSSTRSRDVRWGARPLR